MSLAELNEARKIARDLGIEGASKMKLAALKDAIDSARDDERQYAATMQREEDEQDTPEAAAAHDRLDRENELSRQRAEGYADCSTCGDRIYPGDRVEGDAESGFECEMCIVQPHAGPQGVAEAMSPLKGDGTDDDEPHGDGVLDEPRLDCADPECAAAAAEANAVETRKNARLRLISEDKAETRAVLDVPQARSSFRHLAIPGLRVTVCMKARPTARLGTGSLDSVDCLDCLDKLVELSSRP